MIPENESFSDYKDKIIECVNNFIRLPDDNIKDFLRYVDNTTIKEKDYKTLLDRIIECPYDRNTMVFATYCNVIFDNDNKYRDTSILILKLILQKYKLEINEFEDLYHDYLPMLQQADDETLSNMQPMMLKKLFILYAFFEKIQVNDENLLLENLPFQQLKELQTLLIQNNFNNLLKKIDISFLNKNIDKIFIKKDGKIDFESTLFEVNKLLSVKHLDLPQTQKDNINNILNIKDDLANIDFEKIKIDKTNNFEVLKSKVKNILENDNSIGDNDKKIILAKFTNDIDSQSINIQCTLRGIGNVCDTLTINADGTGYITQRLFVERITSQKKSTSYEWNYSKATHRFFRNDYSYSFDAKDNKPLILCSHLDVGENEKNTAFDNSIGWINVGGVGIAIRMTEFDGDIAKFKKWLDDNEVYVVAPQSKPITVNLSKDEVDKILSLHTYYPSTKISADADFEATYIADTRKYIDSKVS